MKFSIEIVSTHVSSNCPHAAKFCRNTKVFFFFADAVYCKTVSHPLVLMFHIFTTAGTNVWFDITVGEGHVLVLWTSCVLCLHEARNDAICVLVRGLLCGYAKQFI